MSISNDISVYLILKKNKKELGGAIYEILDEFHVLI